MLFASRLVLGVGAAAVCSTAALLGLYRGEMRDKVIGWRATATTAGGFAYPLLAGALGISSWHAPFARRRHPVRLAQVHPREQLVNEGLASRCDAVAV